MRLGEIKNILEAVLNDENKIQLDSSAIYGGQAYTVKNYKELIKAIEILFTESWNTDDDENIKKIISKYGKIRQSAQLDANEFSLLSSYISSLNNKIPYFYSILETMVEDQDEQIINIKLPEDTIDTLSKLSAFNKRLDTLLKLFSIDGQFEFRGIDKGTTWYEILVIGVMSYRGILACLKISGIILEQKKTYWEGKKVELDYKASLSDVTTFTKEGLKAYVDKRIKMEIESLLIEEIKKLKLENSKSSIELQNQLAKGIELLVEEIGKNGTEFHLSLNPPSYIKEVGGDILIEYEHLPAIKSKAESKQLSSGSQSNT